MNRKTDSGDIVSRTVRYLMCAVLFSAAAGIAPAQEYPWQIESSMTYETGKYGTDQDTRLFYWPVTIKRYWSKGDVSLTVPYLNLDTPGGATVIDGAVVTGSGSGGSGLGDVSCKGRYNWIEQNDTLPFVDLTARLKLPTADEDKGLGTGEADVGFGAELARRFMKDYIGFADLAYTFIGDPPDVDYDNRIDADLGLGYQFTQELMGSVFYIYRSAISDGSDDDHSVSFLANYKVSPQVKTYGMLSLGLSDGGCGLRHHGRRFVSMLGVMRPRSGLRTVRRFVSRAIAGGVNVGRSAWGGGRVVFRGIRQVQVAGLHHGEILDPGLLAPPLGLRRTLTACSMRWPG